MAEVSAQLAIDVRPGGKSGRQLGAIVTRKVIELAGVVITVTLITTVIIRLTPGSPATNILGPAASRSSIAALNRTLGLDRPLVHQVLGNLGQLVRGDLGHSLTQGRTVASIIGQSLPVTLLLIGCAIALAVLVGVPLGLATGFSRRPGWDRAVGIGTSLLIALPPFVVGTLLVFAFAVGLKWLPAGGSGNTLSSDITHLVLPSITLAMIVVSPVARSVYRGTRDALGQEYVDAARSRGISTLRIALRHILPVVSIPLITLLCYSASILIGGAIIVEAVFSMPGFGSALNTAVLARDYPTVAGMAVVVAVMVVLITMIGDLLTAVIDPRRRED